MTARPQPRPTQIANSIMRLMLVGLASGGLFGIPTAYSMLTASPSASVAEAVTDTPIVDTEAGSPETMTIPRSPDGFFYVDVGAGARRLPCLIDTGASTLTLSSSAAAKLGAGPTLHYDQRLIGATGATNAAVWRIDHFRVARRDLNDVKALVVHGQGPSCLIGQQLLRRLGAIRVENDELQVG